VTEQEAAEFRALREKMGMARKRSKQTVVESQPQAAAAAVPEVTPVALPAKQPLFDFLLDQADKAWSEWESKQQSGKKGNMNYWWYFIRCARAHSRMMGMSAIQAARQLKAFFERCVAIVQGAEQAPSDQAVMVAQRFVSRLQRQGEVMNATDLENKVLKVWDSITSTPGESKVTAAVRCMFDSRHIDASQLVPVVGTPQYSNRPDGPMNYHDPMRGLPKRDQAPKASVCIRGLNLLRASYVTTVAKAGDVREWFRQNCFHRENAKSGSGWQAEDCPLEVPQDNARRCFAFMLWQLWLHLRQVPDERFVIGERVKMILGSGDVAAAMGAYVPIAESTVADLRKWMVDEGVLRLMRQGGMKNGRLVASEYEFDPIGWMLWWSRERLVVVDDSPIDWS
jgi:hypothetical protein